MVAPVRDYAEAKRHKEDAQWSWLLEAAAEGLAFPGSIRSDDTAQTIGVCGGIQVNRRRANLQARAFAAFQSAANEQRLRRK